MKTGITYMRQHSSRHIETDIKDMASLRVDDVLLTAQENDFIHFPGAIQNLSKIARDHGIRPLAIFWGALNLFGGGQSSQFLLEHPEGFQISRDGKQSSHGCHVNSNCRRQIKEMIDTIAENGFEGYFVDEPTPLRDCFCPSCTARFAEWYDSELQNADSVLVEQFRQRCVVDYVKDISRYCKGQHPQLETICCLMPWDSSMWRSAADIEELDNIGTDIYWANEKRDVEEMRPIVRELDGICRSKQKTHHEWLQCWAVESGNEQRIFQQGRVLVEEQPDTLYVWAYEAQVGTSETCENYTAAWRQASHVLRLAKGDV